MDCSPDKYIPKLANEIAITPYNKDYVTVTILFKGQNTLEIPQKTVVVSRFFVRNQDILGWGKVIESVSEHISNDP